MGHRIRLRAIEGGGEGEVGIRRREILKRNCAGQHPSVQLRQHHVHGEIGGGEATRALCPGGAQGGGRGGLQHRRAAFRKQRRCIARGKCGGGDDDVRREIRQGGAQRGPPGFGLQARHEQGKRGDASCHQRRPQGVHRGGVRRQPLGTVEQHEGAGPAIGHRGVANGSRIDDAGARAVERGLRHRERGRGHNARPSGRLRHALEQRRHVLRAAGAEAGKPVGELVLREGRKSGKPGVVLILAGQQSERDVVRPRHGGELLGAVAPPVEPSELAHQDHLRSRRHLAHPKVHRQRVGEVLQPRQAQAGKRIAPRAPGRGQGDEVAVGEGECHHVARRLGKIDRLGEILQRRRCGGEDVHGARRLSPGWPAPPRRGRSP